MKYGFIGAGNMGSAIMKGMLKDKRMAKNIYAYDVDQKKVSALTKVNYLPLNELVDTVDIIVLAVKPQMMDTVLQKLQKHSLSKKIIITIAAGLPCKYYEEALNTSQIVRVMPNINAMYQESITALCKGKDASTKALKEAEKIFNTVGETVVLEERLLPAFSAIGGASPAFTFMYADALALAGLKAGLPRDIAIKVAAQAIKGSATTLLESNIHPEALRDQVTSPGGTTIEGVSDLEEHGFKGIIMEAIEEVIEKDEELGEDDD